MSTITHPTALPLPSSKETRSYVTRYAAPYMIMVSIVILSAFAIIANALNNTTITLARVSAQLMVCEQQLDAKRI